MFTIAVIFALIFLIPVHSTAQERDYGTWVAFDVSKDISQKISLESEEEVRFFKNMGELDRFSTSLSGDFTFSKSLKGGAGYMWIYNHKVKSDSWDNRHRYFIFLLGRQKLERFTFSLRERFQSTFYGEEEKLEGYEYTHKNYLRSRLMVVYDIRNNKLEPYVSAEMYYSLNKSGGNEINDMRYTLGAEFPLYGKLSLDTFIRLDSEMNVNNPVAMYIAGINLKLKL